MPRRKTIPYFASQDFARFAVPLGSLKLDPNNEKLHSRANIDHIKHLLRTFGWRELVHIYGASEDPETRARATLYPAIDLNEDYPVVVNGYDASDWERGVEYEIEVDWALAPAIDFGDDAQTAAAWRVGHNRSPSDEYDQEALARTLVDNDALDWGAIGGWTEDELAEYLTDESTTVTEHERKLNNPDDEDDVVPPVPAEPQTELGEVVELGPHVLHCADCIEVMRSLPDNSVDAIVTDPPYGLSPDGRARTWDDIEAMRKAGKKGPTSGVLGRAWDAGVPGITWAKECLRVLKPGGHVIAFSATRTEHRLTCALEDAGFEIRDKIVWLQWQGFPKSHDVSQAIDEALGIDRTVPIGAARDVIDANYTRPQFSGLEWDASKGPAPHRMYQRMAPASELAEAWDGWGTTLKPAHEPHVVARKPLDKIAPKEAAELLGSNFIWSSRNVDTPEKLEAASERWAVEVPFGSVEWTAKPLKRGGKGRVELRLLGSVLATKDGPKHSAQKLSTVALNLIKWGTGGFNIDACRIPYGDPAWPGPDTDRGEVDRFPANAYACAKPGRTERNAGAGELPQEEKIQLGAGRVAKEKPGSVNDKFKSKPMANTHPTVKPVKLMRWLLRLVTPPGGTVLEPFGGSGTTLVAAARLGIKVIVSELDPAYCDIIRARAEHALAPEDRAA